MDKIYLITICLMLFSCSVRCQNGEKTYPKQQKLYEKQEQMEIKIWSKYAEENGYKKGSYQQFNERCKYLLGIDLDTVGDDDNHDIAVNSDFSICKTGQYLRTFGEGLFYQPWLDNDVVTKEQALKMLYDKKNGLGEEFLAYNKLLFNDDKTVEKYFISNLEHAECIVFLFNYENSDELIEKALEVSVKNDNFADPDCPKGDIIKFLFYNNINRGYRKKLLTKMYQRHCQSDKSLEKFFDLAEQFGNYFTDFKYPQKTKDS